MDEEKLENRRFEEEEKEIAAEVERQEAEVRRILEKTSALAGVDIGGIETSSQSEWSDEDPSEPLLVDNQSTGYTTDDPALENLSLVHDAGLTDAEGALSDVNSVNYELGCGYGRDYLHDNDESDNLSLSSRASSRIFDSDALVSVDSEYEERGGHGAMMLDPAHALQLRSVTQSIARNFGPRPLSPNLHPIVPSESDDDV